MTLAITTASLLSPTVANAEPAPAQPEPHHDVTGDVTTRVELRVGRTLDRQLKPPGALDATAVAVAVAPPPAPPVPVVPVATYRPKHAAVPPKKTVKNGDGNAGGHYVAPPAYSGSRAQAIVNFVLAQVGDSYVHGATGPSAWDCSGLSRAAAALVGVNLPHNADAQRGYGRAITRAELQPGDLIFWNGHVGVSIGGGMMVAAANTREGVVRQKIYGTPIAYRRIV